MPPTSLPKPARFRAWGLLDMLYTPAELAEELGIARDLVYKVLLPGGLPHTRDDTGHIWIHGATAAAWILAQKKTRQPLAPDQFLCLHCRTPVTPDPAAVAAATSGRFRYLKSICPICGTAICRGAP